MRSWHPSRSPPPGGTFQPAIDRWSDKSDTTSRQELANAAGIRTEQSVFKVEFRSVTEVGVRENSSEEASLGLHYFESVAARPSAVSNAMRAVKEPLLNDRGYASRGNGTPARQVIRRAPRTRRVSIAEGLVYPDLRTATRREGPCLMVFGPFVYEVGVLSAPWFHVETRADPLHPAGGERVP